MEIYIRQQLADLGAAMLLGIVCGLVYDLLRPVRLQHRRSKTLTHLVDAVFVLLVLLGIFLFALRIGQGEFRLFMLFGFIGGAVVYYLLLSALLRPLWDFWAEAAAKFLALLWMPLALIGRGVKKMGRRLKKDFHFLQKYSTIKRYKWDFTRIRSDMSGNGGRSGHEKSKKSKKKS